MSTAKLRSQIKREIDHLPAARLELAKEILAVLAARGTDETFEEYVNGRPPIEERLKEAEEDVRAGRLTPVSKLKRKYA